MHRSGTSALTRVLALSGYMLPKTLMEAAPDNEEGFWESRPISELNDLILREIGSQWDDPFAFSPGKGRSTALNGFRKRALDLIRSEFPDARSIVFKDPRVTILYDFWVEVLREAGYEPVPLVCVRNPLEVAASLARRNSTPTNKSLLIWLSYQLAAERATRDVPRAFVMFEDLIFDWRSCLDRIEHVLGISLERRDPEAELLIERFLKPELRHHTAADDRLRIRSEQLSWLADAYDWFKAAARDSAPDVSALDPVVAEYKRQRQWIGPIVADSNLRLREAEQRAFKRIADLEQRILDANRVFQAEIDKRDDETRRLSAHYTTERDDLSEKLAIAQRELADAADVARRRIEELEQALAAETAWREAEQLNSTQRISLLQSNLDELNRQHLAHLKELANAHQLQSQQETRRIAHAYDEAINRREAEIRSEQEHAQTVINNLEAEIARERVVAREKFQALDQVTAQYQAVLSSTTWRVSSPLRRLGAKVPWLSRATRTMLRGVWSVVTLRFLRPAPAPRNIVSSSGPPIPISAPVSAAYRSPLTSTAEVVGQSQGYRAFDPGPIAGYLAAELGDPSLIEVWNQHCAQFPLPFDADKADKPKLALSDVEAAEWIARCQAKGAGLASLGGAPDVSIVIPVYNQLPFTLSAIASVYAQRTRFSFEILLADDNSTDQTRTIVDGALPRVRVIRHPANLGFLRNCNAAAEQARGRYLVFLNNDTIALPGWLDELIAPIEANPAVGYVGSKLLYPNGVLQEAGGIVWRDGSAWNWGRNQDPRDPKYCYAREVDYCSGASIASPVELWRKLRGFDAARYETAYYEDVDYAFRVREAGFKVVYQPLSALVHFEGISSGVDLSAGVKQYQVENGKRFFERWNATLQYHRPNGSEPLLECERNISARMLVIDAVTPTPDHDAGSLVMMEMIRAFGESGWRISFLPEDNYAHMPGATARLQRSGIEALYWPHYKSVEELLRARGSEFDVVLISRVGCAAKHLETVRRHAPKARVLFNTVDLHYLREARAASLSKDPAAKQRSERTKATELGIVAASDLTIVHSTVEKDILSSEVTDARVYVFPWVAEARRNSPALTHRRHVVFVGGFRHAPNVDAVIWFLSEIWPRVRAGAPDASLQIVGSEAPPELGQYHGVNGVMMMGWVADLDALLEDARLTVAPLRYGAGVKGKVVSSLSNGVPAVCTSIASEGMELVAGREVLVADDPAAFAEAVLRILTDDALWAALSANGLTFVEENYSRRAARRRVAEMARLIGVKPL